MYQYRARKDIERQDLPTLKIVLKKGKEQENKEELKRIDFKGLGNSIHLQSIHQGFFGKNKNLRKLLSGYNELKRST